MRPNALLPLLASAVALLSLTGCYEETYYGRPYPYHTAYYGGDYYYHRPYYTDVNVVYNDGYHHRDWDDRRYYRDHDYHRDRDDHRHDHDRDDRRHVEYRKQVQYAPRNPRQEVIVKKKRDHDHDRD